MMTHDEIIEVVKADKEGKPIQFRRLYQKNGKWRDVLQPGWDFLSYEFRVKPELIEVWVVVSYNNKAIGSFTDKKHAESVAVNFKDSRVVRMIEAEEEKND